MGNSASADAQSMAAMAKMSKTLNDVKGTLTMDPTEVGKQNAKKKTDKNWEAIHRQTQEDGDRKKAESKERVSAAKARWEAARKKRAAKK